MRLRTTSTVFPGGWRYPQLDLQGKLLKSYRSMGPYSGFIDEILKFRTANRLARASWEEVDIDVQNYLCGQCGNDVRYCIDGSKKNSILREPFRAAKRAAGVVSSVARGASILKDWLGTGGKPIPREAAQNRADLCTGRLSGVPCPHNRSDVDGTFFTAPIARIIREQLERKNELKMSVEGEEQLHTCDVCLCALKLKVHVPFATISARTPAAMFNKFKQDAPGYCWMLTENIPA